MDAKITIRRTIRLLRESSGLSQEKLAEQAGITYQYLSAVENGKENFTIGILEALAGALGVGVAPLIIQAYESQFALPPRVEPAYFIPDAPLLPGLHFEQLGTVLNETHQVVILINTTLMKMSQRPLPAYIQSNNFSGIVSHILCDSFSRLTPYKHYHDQRYPDLVYKNARGRQLAGLEVKSTIRPGKEGESHNGHSG